MKGLILAAGYGTRLYPLTLERPKPLLEVGGKTILERLLSQIEKVKACDEVYIVTNGRFYNVIDEWVSAHKYRFRIETINDNTMTNEDRLGAIGDIDLVLKLKQLEEDLLIVAGDNLFEFDIVDFISFAKKQGHLSIAFFDVKDKALAKRYGIVSLDRDRRVVDFTEKPQEPPSTLASTGIYYLPAKKLGKFSEYMRTANPKDAPGYFVKWMSENDKAFGYVFTEGWYDIGDLVSLSKADEEYRNKNI